MCWVTPNPIPEPVRPYPDDEWTYFAPPRIRTDQPGTVVPKEKVMTYTDHPGKAPSDATGGGFIATPAWTADKKCSICGSQFNQDHHGGGTISLASSINNRNKGRESHDYDLYLCEKCVGLGLADRLDKLVIDTMKAQAGYWEGAGQGGE